ncbi:MAG: hypothetical protein KGJ06_02050 [Pseudomonadota bacterium]|nr:hypothetical protein [Pseudomonadota bacterium]
MAEQVTQGSKIKWGMIIAGAAIAAGAILFAPSLQTQIPEMFSGLVENLEKMGATIGKWIASFFTAPDAGVPGAEAFAKSKFMEWVTSPEAKKVAGVGLMGGGIAYLLGHKDKQPDGAQRPAESFVMKEDMRKMQALMTLQAAYAGNPQAQAMLAQGQGRGA